MQDAGGVWSGVAQRTRPHADWLRMKRSVEIALWLPLNESRTALSTDHRIPLRYASRLTIVHVHVCMRCACRHTTAR